MAAAKQHQATSNATRRLLAYCEVVVVMVLDQKRMNLNRQDGRRDSCRCCRCWSLVPPRPLWLRPRRSMPTRHRSSLSSLFCSTTAPWFRLLLFVATSGLLWAVYCHHARVVVSGDRTSLAYGGEPIQKLLLLPHQPSAVETKNERLAGPRQQQPFDPSLAQSVLAQPIRLDRCKVHKPPRPPSSPNNDAAAAAAAAVEAKGVVVTAYFRIKSKYASDNYDKWMKNFLSIGDKMIIFTQSDMVETIQKLRGADRINDTVIVEMSLEDLPIAHLTGRSSTTNSTDFWMDQLNSKDKEKKRHRSYEVFWIWLSKSWFVVQAIEHFNDVFASQFFMWSDIGCFRHTGYNGKNITQYPEMVPRDTVLWEAHHAPNPPPDPIFWDKLEPTKKKYFYHSGSQGAGTPGPWKRFHNQFAKTMDEFLDNDYFIGEDQCVLQAACLQAPSLCSYVPYDQVNDNHYFGLRYVLHNGPNSARTPDQQYRYWKPPGSDQLL